MLKHLALMSSLLLPIAAYAQTAEQPTEQAPGAESHSWKTDPQGNAMFSREDTAIAFPRLSGHFDEIDADKDGYLSRAEIREWHQATHQGKEKQKDAAPKEGMRQGKMKQAADRFKEADKNSDGKLSREEAKAMPRIDKNFDAIDADKDGQVTPDEIRAAMKAKAKTEEQPKK